MINNENEIIEDVEEKDLVENQELEQEFPEEAAEDQSSQPLTQDVLDVLLGETKEEEEAEEDEDEMSESEEAEEEEDEMSESEEEEEDEMSESEEEDDEDEIELPEVATKAGYLAASFDALKSMKKSSIVAAYKSINMAEGEDDDMPKNKADIINAMYGQLKAMKKDDIMASYKAIKDSCGGMHEEIETDVYAEDLKVLTDSEKELTEGFKSKVAILFEGAIANRTIEIKEELEAQYQDDLQEEVTYIRENVVNKIDDYLSYVVESWIQENQEFVDNKLRTDIAENFMKSLQQVFTEHYIEVPDSEVNLVDSLSDDLKATTEQLEEVQNTNESLSEELENLHRRNIIEEASKDLANTEKVRFMSLLEEVEFNGAKSFASKVETIKENFDFSSTTEVIQESEETHDSTNVKTIVEGAGDPNANLSSDMQRYVNTLSRFNK
jgi:hypothetical protein